MLKFVSEVSPHIKPSGGKQRLAIYVCDCGKEEVKYVSNVNVGRVKNCSICSRALAGKARGTHNNTNHPLYRKWCDMKNRCYNSKVDRFKNYGGNGIKVCDEWKNSFQKFYDWSIENGWKEGLTIERKNIKLDYSPENCTYIPYKEQDYNKSTTKWVEYNGENVCLAKLCKDLGLTEKDYHAIWIRLNKGKSLQEAIRMTKELKEKKRLNQHTRTTN